MNWVLPVGDRLQHGQLRNASVLNVASDCWGPISSIGGIISIAPCNACGHITLLVPTQIPELLIDY